MRYLVVGLLLGCFLFPAAVNAQLDGGTIVFDEGVTAAEVPFERNSDKIYVSVMLNGKGPFWMVLDTGSPGMILDTQAADSRARHRSFVKQLGAEARCHESLVSGAERQARLGQKPATVWLTGLTGSGKSAIAYALERQLFDDGHLARVLDGRNLRLGLSEDLAFTDEDRSENLRRAAEVAKLFNDSGLISICAFLSPRRQDRQAVRQIVGEDRFIEVFLDTPEEVCRQRVAEHPDPGSLKPFGDASAPYEGYENPEEPEVTVQTHEVTVDACVERILECLFERGCLQRKGGESR